MNTHELKTWPEFYEVIASGEKTFELRYDDRGFHAGDILRLREWSLEIEQYTGREMSVTVTYLWTGFGLKSGWVVMGFQPNKPLNPTR